MTKKKKGAKIFKTLQDIFEAVGAALMNKEVVAVTPSGDKFIVEDVVSSDEGATIKLVPADAPTSDEDEDGED